MKFSRSSEDGESAFLVVRVHLVHVQVHVVDGDHFHLVPYVWVAERLPG